MSVYHDPFFCSWSTLEYHKACEESLVQSLRNGLQEQQFCSLCIGFYHYLHSYILQISGFVMQLS